MTNIRFHGSARFGSSKSKPENMFRPKSSRYESRKMCLKHRNSLDSSDPSSDHLLHKRSNSLQSLNTIDTQNNIDERAKLSAKPRRIAWASSKTCSADKSFEAAVETWNPSEVLDQVEPCVEYRNKLEESKKKSIDIFLSRNFIDPMDILPSNRNPRLSLMKSFTSSFNVTVDKYEPESSENASVQIDEQISNDGKSEKKVTFAPDLGESANNAEIRRMNFRNSYSKRYSTNFSFSSTSTSSSSRLERQTSVGKCSTPKCELTRSAMKRGNSLSSAENTDELAQIACGPTSPSPSPSPLFKQPMQPISQQSDKMKQQLIIKRKLKSCRSRSFHKSLDNSSVIENFDTFSFTKPLKSNQNSDVVTMVSLIVSNDEDTAADSTNHSQSTNKSDATPRIKENIDNKSEKQTKTGILKSKWQSDNIKRANTQPMQKRRFINVSHKLISSPEKTSSNLVLKKYWQKIENYQMMHFCMLFRFSLTGFRKSSASLTILTAVDNLTKTEENRRLNRAHSSDSGNSTYSVENETLAEAKEVETDKPFQSAKEQECWSSFRKMTNKGFSVSFDTILSAHAHNSAITWCTFESRGELTCKLELELCTRTKCDVRIQFPSCMFRSFYDVIPTSRTVLCAMGLLTPTEYRLRRNEISTQE
ncbi:dentin sialophosphoprotein isoform X2 [Planococcus citri]